MASEARVETLLADSASPPLPCGAVRHPQPGKLPTESRGVFHADRLSIGAVVPSISWERLWGGRAEPLPRLCVGLCELGLCVTVTQIVVGEPGSGDAVHRIVLII